MKKAIMAVILIVAGTLFFIGVSFFMEYNDTTTQNGAVVKVEIPKGASEQTIARCLKKSGIIKYEMSFRMKMRQSPYRGKLNYGTFELNRGMCLDDIIEALLTPSVKEEGIKLSVPEGYSAEMIAARCEKIGLVSSKDFLSELENGKFSFGFIDDIPKVESVKYKLQGYLFPSTYIFKKTATAHTVIETMLAEFDKQYSSVEGLNKNDLKMNDVIIAASLIEREAKLDSERKIISGVIQNRIAEGMRLQIDATVVYAISDGLYDVERVLYKDLETASPYNTYKNAGLPVGAICNPGIKSIEAALQPQKNTYLYYHTDEKKNDGSHVFTQTFNEHKSTEKK